MDRKTAFDGIVSNDIVFITTPFRKFNSMAFHNENHSRVREVESDVYDDDLGVDTYWRLECYRTDMKPPMWRINKANENLGYECVINSEPMAVSNLF